MMAFLVFVGVSVCVCVLLFVCVSACTRIGKNLSPVNVIIIILI